MCRWQPPEQLHIWVGGVKTAAGKMEVAHTLEEAGLQRPYMLPVSGMPAGLLLRFASPSVIAPALRALQARIGGCAPAPAAPVPAAPPLPAPARLLRQEPPMDAQPCTLWVGQVGRQSANL